MRCRLPSSILYLTGPRYFDLTAGRDADDEPRAPAVGEPCPRPVHIDDESVAKTRQQKEMDERPEQPCGEAAQVDAPKVGNCAGATNDCQRAEIAVAEGA